MALRVLFDLRQCDRGSWYTIMTAGRNEDKNSVAVGNSVHSPLSVLGS